MSITPVLDIALESALWEALPDAEKRVEQAVEATLARAGVKVSPHIELSVLLVDDAHIRQLNKEWRGKDKPTNVLSFQAFPPDRLVNAPMLGDLVVAYETMAREAVDEKKKCEDHFSHLIVHGTLHLLGFDHETNAEAEIMENMEREILASLGIPDPYSDTVALLQPH